MREESRAYIFTCDAPACDTKIIMETDELPDGFHGDVTEVSPAGGNGGSWFACKATHIRAAVEEALARRD